MQRAQLLRPIMPPTASAHPGASSGLGAAGGQVAEADSYTEALHGVVIWNRTERSRDRSFLHGRSKHPGSKHAVRPVVCAALAAKNGA